MGFNQKNIFLFDGIGALLSAVFTGLLLPLFSDLLGIQTEILHRLALLPMNYAVYSLSCYKLVKKIRSWNLLVIIFANLAYCLISGTVIFKTDGIANLGTSLLLAEILVVIAVVALEIRVYKKFFTT